MTDWLIDKSAIPRLHLAPNAAEWASRIERGLVRISTVTRLEVGYSARSAADHERCSLTRPSRRCQSVPHTPDRRPSRRAPDDARRPRQHRAPSVPDLLIAATVMSELTVLHGQGLRPHRRGCRRGRRTPRDRVTRPHRSIEPIIQSRGRWGAGDRRIVGARMWPSRACRGSGGPCCGCTLGDGGRPRLTPA